MRILIATDAFPPISGGSGWSTYELARGLRARGHHVFIVRTYSERDPIPADYDGFAVSGFPAFAPRIPFVRNYVRNERLYDRLSRHLVTIIKKENIDLVHAQHVLTGPPSVAAARRAGIPSVCTVRDYWPVCYWGDVLADPIAGEVCPGCSSAAMMRCLRPRTGAAWPATLPMIPYMRSNLRHKQQHLSAATAIVAVSTYVATTLRARGSDMTRARIVTIPNGVDVSVIRAEAAATERPLSEGYALFVGKLARNKGANALVSAAEQARLRMPLVIIGDGPERRSIEHAAAAVRRDVRILGWRDRREVFQWLHHATLLVFPSVWPEPLSRVLIEASALSVPTAAINTGGTADIIVDEETGLLSTSVSGLAEDVARLMSDASLSTRLASAAASRAAAHFDIPVVIGRMEALYQELLAASPQRNHNAIA
jgi:glycosyltransferase involved in cell wall biosynthesis